MKYLARLLDYLDVRTGFRQHLGYEVTEKLTPAHRGKLDYFSCFGGVALVFFLIQVITGGILLAKYIPHEAHAFQSVQALSEYAEYGWFVRRVHAIGANFMILVVLIHLFKVFLAGAYKAPRELHWISGVCLFGMTLAMCLSGYLLPWSQLSYWASTVATDTPGQIPWIGTWLKELIRGGPTVTGITLGRFFVAHVFFIPGAMALFMFGHFIMIRKTGIAEPL